ncbi:alcohol dehydrogenase [Kitasatospora sp. MAP12-15]|uniref:alcohol dehydrogenase catalytic domain-containing protein n=1 Tax=unclassified Kitasatospora TaxID=2633591 RepID=UPI0024739448|nr:alcohol dehydrogenase catalytic domain-containing protein [Kitasatospora sp. MAP12-44]MDH6108665.1 alcohol dehydrogenase [Kitasatospora sp. MAP12-44]
MKALSYQGPGRSSWGEAPDPVVLHPEDAVVRVALTSICAIDPDILGGGVPEVAAGRILGHEAVGTVTAIGPGVQRVALGDRVLVSCVCACGRCAACRTLAYGRCTGGGGWLLGHLIDGTQAEYVRTPFADGSLHRLPRGVGDESALLLADLLPTAFEVGVRSGGVGPGDTVLVVGAGPTGLAAIATARLYSPGRIIAVDRAEGRLAVAERIGADVVLPADRVDAERVRALSPDGFGADVAIETGDLPGDWALGLCTRAVRPGGRVARVGPHGRVAPGYPDPDPRRPDELRAGHLTVTAGLVDTSSTPLLLGMLDAGRLDVAGLVTHRFALDEIGRAYEVLAHAGGESGVLKVALAG